MNREGVMNSQRMHWRFFHSEETERLLGNASYFSARLAINFFPGASMLLPMTSIFSFLDIIEKISDKRFFGILSNFSRLLASLDVASSRAMAISSIFQMIEDASSLISSSSSHSSVSKWLSMGMGLINAAYLMLLPSREEVLFALTMANLAASVYAYTLSQSEVRQEIESSYASIA